MSAGALAQSSSPQTITVARESHQRTRVLTPPGSPSARDAADVDTGAQPGRRLSCDPRGRRGNALAVTAHSLIRLTPVTQPPPALRSVLAQLQTIW